MNSKNLSVLTFALLLTACQPTAPLSNAQNIQPSPTVSAQTAPSISDGTNVNSSNSANAIAKSTNQSKNPTPTVSPTPKATTSPMVSTTPKYKNYTANGIVKQVDLENKLIVIDHEDIGDYMVGMEMPFPVVGKDLLKNLKTGDNVEFVLETGVGVERIIKIRKK